MRVAYGSDQLRSDCTKQVVEIENQCRRCRVFVSPVKCGPEPANANPLLDSPFQEPPLAIPAYPRFIPLVTYLLVKSIHRRIIATLFIFADEIGYIS